jgi:FAD/FMN-containing dehydrogenase
VTATLIRAIANIVGARNVLTEADDLARYGSDGRGAMGAALAVVRASSAEEVAAIVRLCVAAGVILIPQGGRTGLVAAGIGDAAGEAIILSLDRLARAPVIDPVNRTAEVDAGTLLSMLNAAAELHGLFFPIDLGADPSIGGMIAANTGGARFLRYRDVRHNLMSVDVVTAEAEPQILKLGAALWKNNSGIDLKQIFVGSSGSLGIVTRATVALSLKPTATITTMLALAEADAVIPLLGALETAFGAMLTAFEGISGPALTAALDHVPRLRNPFPGARPDYAVLVELSAGAALDEDLLEDRLATALEPWLDSGAVLDASIDRGGDLWAIRHAVPEGLRASGRVVACDIALRRGDIMHFRADLKARLHAIAPQMELHDFGHIGDGGLHFNMVWPPAAGPFDAALADSVRTEVFDATVTEYGGSFSAEHGIGPANAAAYTRLIAPEVRELAGRVQRLVAPARIGRVDFAG